MLQPLRYQPCFDHNIAEQFDVDRLTRRIECKWVIKRPWYGGRSVPPNRRAIVGFPLNHCKQMHVLSRSNSDEWFERNLFRKSIATLNIYRIRVQFSSEALDGILIRIGGEDDPVPVHLEDGDKIHICYAKRSIARRLAPHLFGSPLIVSGTGKWRRDPDGSWLMDRFTIQDFTELNDAPLSEVVNKLRKVEGGWKNHEDPLGELDRLRRDPDQIN